MKQNLKFFIPLLCILYFVCLFHIISYRGVKEGRTATSPSHRRLSPSLTKSNPLTGPHFFSHFSNFSIYCVEISFKDVTSGWYVNSGPWHTCILKNVWIDKYKHLYQTPSNNTFPPNTTLPLRLNVGQHYEKTVAVLDKTPEGEMRWDENEIPLYICNCLPNVFFTLKGSCGLPLYFVVKTWGLFDYLDSSIRIVIGNDWPKNPSPDSTQALQRNILEKSFTSKPLKYLHDAEFTGRWIYFPYLIIGTTNLWREHYPHIDEMFNFRDFVSERQHQAHALSKQEEPQRHITFLVREKDRRFLNLEEMVKVAERFPSVKTEVTHFTENQPFIEQIRIMERSNILISPHGAGLVHVMFMPKNSALIEVFYKYGYPPNLAYTNLAKAMVRNGGKSVFYEVFFLGNALF